MGLTGVQTLWQVEVPNALPLIIAGVRSAANQVIATATIAGFVGLGALGVFIFTGTGTRQYDVVAGASIAVIILVLLGRGRCSPSSSAGSSRRSARRRRAPV